MRREEACCLLVEDDPVFGRSMMRVLSNRRFTTLWARSCDDARKILESEAPPRLRYALVDDRLPDGSGLDLLPLVDRLEPAPRVALFSAFFSRERALAALQAHRVLLPKPTEPSQLRHLLAALDGFESTSSAPDLDATPYKQHDDREHLILTTEGLRTHTDLLPLRGPARETLCFLIERRGRLASSAEIARELLRRRDTAASDLVRRRVADLRRALGPYGWLIESIPKCGYRIASVHIAIVGEEQ